MVWSAEGEAFCVLAYNASKSFKYVDKLFKKEFNSKTSPCKNGIQTSPEEVLTRPLHSIKYTAWVAMSKHGIIGPLWFEDEHGNSKTIDSQGYV